MFTFSRLLSYAIVSVTISASLGAQVEIDNTNSLYDACAVFTNSSGPQIVHCAPENTVTLSNVAGLLMLALVQNQPTCSNWKAYIGLCEVTNGPSTNKITVTTGNGGKPIFTIESCSGLDILHANHLEG